MTHWPMRIVTLEAQRLKGRESGGRRQYSPFAALIQTLEYCSASSKALLKTLGLRADSGFEPP